MSKVVQQDLVELGYGDIVGKIDGVVGRMTTNAIREFQKDAKIGVDGIVGVITKRAIHNRKNLAGVIGTRNFSIHEFRSRADGTLPVGGMKSELLLNLELLRWKLGNRAIQVTSGYRTVEENKRVGGIARSNHLTGKAADIKVNGLNANVVHQQAIQIFNGVGKYNNFTHVDVDSRKVHYQGKY